MAQGKSSNSRPTRHPHIIGPEFALFRHSVLCKRRLLYLHPDTIKSVKSPIAHITPIITVIRKSCELLYFKITIKTVCTYIFCFLFVLNNKPCIIQMLIRYYIAALTCRLTRL